MCQCVETVSLELKERGVSHVIDSNRKLYLKSKSPVHIPNDMIPRPVLDALGLYNRGLLTEERLGKQRMYDMRVNLRRYRLIPPRERVDRAQRKEYHKAYLKRWRLKQRQLDA